MSKQKPPIRTFSELDQERAQARATLEAQVAGSTIAWAARGAVDLPGDVLAVAPHSVFVWTKAKEVMQAISQTVTRGRNIDLISVAEELATIKGAICTQADLVEMATKFDSLITSFSVLEAAHALAEEHRKDKAIEALGNAYTALRSFGGPIDLPQQAIKEAAEALDAESSTSRFDFDFHLDGYAAGLESPDRALKPVPLPWGTVNKILRGGLVPGELVILAARPSVGKSAFALNVAYSASCYGTGVLFFSLEMPMQQLLDRVVANVGEVELGKFRQGLDEVNRERARAATRKMRGKPLYIVDSTRITVSEIRRRARIVQRKAGLRLLVIDYLQLLTPGDSSVPREQQVAQMSRELKCLAGELKVPIILLAQLNRKVEESRRDPVLSDLRESGAIEQDADIVIFLHQARSAIGNPNEPVKVIVAKGRSSGVGSEFLEFHRKYQRFSDSEERVFKKVQDEEWQRVYQPQEQELP